MEHYDSDPARGCGVGILIGAFLWLVLFIVAFLLLTSGLIKF